MINKEKINTSIKIMIIYVPILILLIHINKKYNIYIPCIFHKITGLYCPGCGITRMIISTINFKFYQAFRYNPLMFILTPFFAGYYLFYYIYWLKDKKIVINNKIWYLILTFVILYAVLRNIPALKYLVPTKI